jgi:hydroxymethylglutaryl-CoA reductase (NADPH)
MPTQHDTIRKYLGRLSQKVKVEDAEHRLAPRIDPATPRIAGGSSIKPEFVAKRWKLLKSALGTRAVLLDSWSEEHLHEYEHNIENCIGTIKQLVGIAGPLRVNGLFASGKFSRAPAARASWPTV